MALWTKKEQDVFREAVKLREKRNVCVLQDEEILPGLKYQYKGFEI